MSSTWADQPYSLIPTPKHLGTMTDPADAPFVDAASFMCNLHNFMIRGLNSIYLQAPHVPEEDHPAFVTYCLAWCTVIEHHHELEDTKLFLDLDAAAGGEGKSGVLVNSKQHEEFHDALVKFNEYLKQAQRTKEFSGTHTQALISQFGPALHAHLKEEIDTILSLRTMITPEALRKAFADADKQAQKGFTAHTGLFVVMNMDDTYEGGRWKNFLGAPPVMVWFLKNIVGRLNARKSWRYSSCGKNGLPRQTLYALRSVKAA